MATAPTDSRGKGSNRFWAAHLGAWRRSGLSRAEYCRQHGVSYHALSYRHRKKSAGSTAAAGAVLVQVPSITPPVASMNPGDTRIILRVRDRFEVELGGQFDSEALRCLLSVLEGR